MYMLSYLKFVLFVKPATQDDEWNVENDDADHCSHHRRVFDQLLVEIIKDIVEIDGVRGHSKSSAQTAKQVRLEPGPGWRTSWLDLATIARPHLILFIPLLARQFRYTVRIGQSWAVVTRPIFLAALENERHTCRVNVTCRTLYMYTRVHVRMRVQCCLFYMYM